MIDRLTERYVSDITPEEWFGIVEQALQMEREQIVDSYSNGWHDGQDEIINRITHIDKGGDEAGLKNFNETYADWTSRRNINAPAPP